MSERGRCGWCGGLVVAADVRPETEDYPCECDPPRVDDPEHPAFQGFEFDEAWDYVP